MKKILPFTIIFIILLSAFVNCTYLEPILVLTVEYNSVTGNIDITLSRDNYNSLTEIKERITMSAGSFNGPDIDFIVAGSGSNYELQPATPPFPSGNCYITFEEGAFDYDGFLTYGSESKAGSAMVTIP